MRGGIRVPGTAQRKMGAGIEAGAHWLAGILRTLFALCGAGERWPDYRQREPGDSRKRPSFVWLAGQPDHYGGRRNADAVAGPVFALLFFCLSAPTTRHRVLRFLFFRKLFEHRS